MFRAKSWLAFLGFGIVAQFGGCLVDGVARRVVIEGVKYEALDFLLDNDAVFDLFAD